MIHCFNLYFRIEICENVFLRDGLETRERKLCENLQRGDESAEDWGTWLTSHAPPAGEKKASAPGAGAAADAATGPESADKECVADSADKENVAAPQNA